MNEKQIIEQLRDLDKIIDPSTCNDLSNALNFEIMDYEEALYTLNLIVSNEWLKIRESSKSNAETDKVWEVSDVFQKRERVKLTIQQLKRLRSDLKDRYAILTNKRF